MNDIPKVDVNKAKERVKAAKREYNNAQSALRKAIKNQKSIAEHLIEKLTNKWGPFAGNEEALKEATLKKTLGVYSKIGPKRIFILEEHYGVNPTYKKEVCPICMREDYIKI